MPHTPRKRFGQHFLVDQSIIRAIVRAIDPNPNEHMVEIGPGMGAMTFPLLEHLNQLHVIELDRDLANKLATNPRLHVTQSDVLKVDFVNLAAQFGSQIRVVGNLPYNVSTPILFHLLSYANIIRDQHFMLQKEVVDRMVAEPCSKNYGRLSVMLQWRYHIESVLNVGPDAFEPPPRVQSAVVRMVPWPKATSLDFNLLQDLVQTAFSQRRKLLRHTLGHWLDLRSYPHTFDLQRRAEEVPVHEYVLIAEHLRSATRKH